jgi:hypothetical protein
LVYLEQDQASPHGFVAPIVRSLPKVADFLSLGTGFLLVPSVLSPQLVLKAWTLEKSVPEFHLDMPPPLRLRLSAGIPQLLGGPEKLGLASFAARYTSHSSLPLALPVVSDTQILVGVLVLVDSPPFDLEDEGFVLAWTQLKYTILNSVFPKPRAKSTPVPARLQQTLTKGHFLLAARMEASSLMRHAEQKGLLPYRARMLLTGALTELAGEQGAVVESGPLLTAFFVLPGKMDKDLLWHQILGALTWPEGYVARWELTVLHSQADLTRFLGR